MRHAWWWLLGLVVGCAGATAGPGKVSRPTATTKPALSNSANSAPSSAPAASQAAAPALAFEKVADGFGLMSAAPWGAVGAVGSRTLAASDSLLGGVLTLLEFQDTTLARQTLPSGFASPVSVGGMWPQAWVAGRFEFARQNGQNWQTRKLALPDGTDELLVAQSWLGGRVLGLFVPGNRYSGANLRGGVFAVVDGPAGGEPDLHATSCQDCRSIFALDFAALPTGQVYVVGERDGAATLLEFLPSGGRGIFVPTPSFEPVGAVAGPSGKVIALSPHEVYFGAGHRLPIVYRYDGSEVKALPVPHGLPATVEASSGQPLAPVTGLASRPGDDLWAIFGVRNGYPSPGVPLSRLYCYDRAGNWQSTSFPPNPEGQAPDLVDVAVSNGSVWVLGKLGGDGVLYRRALPASVAPASPAAAAPLKKASVAPSYGASKGSFDCGGVTCEGGQVCCKFVGFQRCVSPNVELPPSPGGFASNADEIAKACRTDDFAEKPWLVGVCTASSDCGAGQFCVSPDSENTSVAHCATTAPSETVEICREGAACAEPGSICRLGNCVRGNPQLDCAGHRCAASQVCCAPDNAAEFACRKPDQCMHFFEALQSLTCTSRQHCASGRRCMAWSASESRCLDVVDATGTLGVLCASDAECDVWKCPGSAKAVCARSPDTQLKTCSCPNAKPKP